ncbi:TPA_asm: UL5.5 uORF [Human alphaherpesvirus 1]|jgi:hypothetical protein|eukprot:CCRYP_020505-RA/>CCRYP_020505-RA protein AED:0.50 eAED:0.50 QI:0/-1/0/1/-1/0/1/0/3
MRA